MKYKYDRNNTKNKAFSSLSCDVKGTRTKNRLARRAPVIKERRNGGTEGREDWRERSEGNGDLETAGEMLRCRKTRGRGEREGRMLG